MHVGTVKTQYGAFGTTKHIVQKHNGGANETKIEVIQVLILIGPTATWKGIEIINLTILAS
jgi:hypothetical protein